MLDQMEDVSTQKQCNAPDLYKSVNQQAKMKLAMMDVAS